MPLNNETKDNIMELHYDGEMEVQYVSLFYMQSYGPKWENSTVKVLIQAKDKIHAWSNLTQFTLLGYHNKKTSEMNDKEIILPFPTASLRIILCLIQGTTFKLMGLTICK